MRAFHFLLLLSSAFLFSCEKETEEFQQTDALASYLPTQPGKYITYRIDSTLFTNFGATMEVHSYQEKHQVDALMTDNLGRPSYRVFRFIRDTNGATAWQPSGTYYITVTDKNAEVVENNLRFLKLTIPVKETTTWHGNQFLPADPYGAFYEFSNDDEMMDWEYYYSALNERMTINGKTFPETIRVEQINESVNMPVTGPFHGYVNYHVETFAKGLGMVQQEIKMWEYQPPTSPRPGYRGFGVKRSIIDHN
jgi:hypothetical protein